MTTKDFLKLGKRDWVNGAVRGEIYNSLKDREKLQGENERLRETISRYRIEVRWYRDRDR